MWDAADSTGVDCCTADGKHLPPELRHEHCFTLDVLPGDSFYGRFGVECINFVRSMVAPRSDCMFGYAEQLSQVRPRPDGPDRHDSVALLALVVEQCADDRWSFGFDDDQVTHWHDASTVYGNTKAMSDLLREHRGGRLKTLNMDGRQMLPLDPNNKECLGYKQGLRCFMTGTRLLCFSFLSWHLGFFCSGTTGGVSSLIDFDFDLVVRGGGGACSFASCRSLSRHSFDTKTRVKRRRARVVRCQAIREPTNTSL